MDAIVQTFVRAATEHGHDERLAIQMVLNRLEMMVATSPTSVLVATDWDVLAAAVAKAGKPELAGIVAATGACVRGIRHPSANDIPDVHSSTTTESQAPSITSTVASALLKSPSTVSVASDGPVDTTVTRTAEAVVAAAALPVVEAPLLSVPATTVDDGQKAAGRAPGESQLEGFELVAWYVRAGTSARDTGPDAAPDAYAMRGVAFPHLFAWVGRGT